MKITFDPAKRRAAIAERGLDFVDAEVVFAGMTITVEDTRRDYGETRNQTVGFPGRSNGDDRLDAARRGATHHLDEKMQ